jgi:hypothetical protein
MNALNAGKVPDDIQPHYEIRQFQSPISKLSKTLSYPSRRRKLLRAILFSLGSFVRRYFGVPAHLARQIRW